MTPAALILDGVETMPCAATAAPWSHQLCHLVFHDMAYFSYHGNVAQLKAQKTSVQQGVFLFFCDTYQIQTGLNHGLRLKQTV